MTTHDGGHSLSRSPPPPPSRPRPPTSAPTPTPAWAPATTEPGLDAGDSRPDRDTDPDPHRCRGVGASPSGGSRRGATSVVVAAMLSAVLAAGGTAALVTGPFAPSPTAASAIRGALTGRRRLDDGAERPRADRRRRVGPRLGRDDHVGGVLRRAASARSRRPASVRASS